MSQWRERRLDVVGSIVGVLFVTASLTPSLLPRPAWGQGLVAGLAFALGYGLGVLTWRLIRLLSYGRLKWDASAPAWLVTVGTGALFVALSPLAVRWQNDIREAVGIAPMDGLHWLGIVLGGSLGVWLGFAIGRGVRRLHNFLRKGVVALLTKVSRRDHGPRPVAVSLTAGATSVVGVLLVLGVGTTILSLLLTSLYGARNDHYDPAFAQPTTELRSGSSSSAVSWESVGQAGAKVVGGGPSVEELSAITGTEATEPIRIYVGMDSAPTLAERAQLAVEELERTGAADRAQLLVAGTTGSGWLDPAAIDGFEYLHAGDTALVTLQYGATPSPVSALLTPDLAPEGTSALFDAVYEWWSALPDDSRPQLTVYGLSLGSYGMNAAFDSEQELLDKTNGAVLAGTPSFTSLWSTLQDRRDEGSPYALPVLDQGEHVRWTDRWGGLEEPSSQWDGTKVAYLQHGNDPIVWIGPSVIWSEPAWLQPGQRSDQVSDDMFWIPGVTAFQGIIDLILSQGVPEDQGHKYGNLALDSLHVVTGDADLDEDALERVRTVIATYDTFNPLAN